MVWCSRRQRGSPWQGSPSLAIRISLDRPRIIDVVHPFLREGRGVGQGGSFSHRQAPVPIGETMTGAYVNFHAP